VTARGIERRAIFETERDNRHFLELLEEITERYRVQVHAYALMGNHYHLLIRTPQANASRVMQWLNVSYSAWFNRKRERVGHVFQGRFQSVVIDGNGSWALNASIHVHLNPIRVMRHGLGKTENRAEGVGFGVPNREEIRGRLRALQGYRWSSFWFYALTRTIPIAAIPRLVEKKRRTPWAEIRDQHGDWGREMALYLARCRSGMTLWEIGEAFGGLEYKTVGKAVGRFAASLDRDSSRRRMVKECLIDLSHVEGLLPQRIIGDLR
jgi:REP element-mobilizing transposase RayT